MTVGQLREYTVKDLAALARKHGVEGWHAMRKEDLVRAVSAACRAKERAKARLAAARAQAAGSGGSRKSRKSKLPKAGSNGRQAHHAAAPAAGRAKVPSPAARQRLEADRQRRNRRKDLAYRSQGNGRPILHDRLVVMVRDPYWLHAYWELTHRGVDRARVALGQDWHAARPVLRLVEVGSQAETTATERTARLIDIHGGVTNWYIDVDTPGKHYRVEIGYCAASGRFYSLARSNVVTMPTPGESDSIDENWTEVAENFDRICAFNSSTAHEGPAQELQELFEERLRRPMNRPAMPQLGLDDPLASDFPFEVDAELIVYGKAEPDAKVTLKGDPVELRPDGTFTVRYNLPNCRQVIPVTARSADQLQSRTTVLAIERNTKTMEPVLRDSAN